MEGKMKTVVEDFVIENTNLVCETIADYSFEKTRDESVQRLLSDIVDAVEKCVEEIGKDYTNAFDDIKFIVEKDSMLNIQHMSSIKSDYKEVKKSHDNIINTISLHIKEDFVTSQAKRIDKELNDFSEVNNEAVLSVNIHAVSEHEETMTEHIISDSCDYSELTTKEDDINHADNNASIMVHSSQCKPVNTSDEEYNEAVLSVNLQAVSENEETMTEHIISDSCDYSELKRKDDDINHSDNNASIMVHSSQSKPGNTSHEELNDFSKVNNETVLSVNLHAVNENEETMTEHIISDSYDYSELKRKDDSINHAANNAPIMVHSSQSKPGNTSHEELNDFSKVNNEAVLFVNLHSVSEQKETMTEHIISDSFDSELKRKDDINHADNNASIMAHSSQSKPGNTSDEELNDFSEVNNEAVLFVNLHAVSENEETMTEHIISDSCDYSELMTKNDDINHADNNASIMVHSSQSKPVNTSDEEYNEAVLSVNLHSVSENEETMTEHIISDSCDSELTTKDDSINHADNNASIMVHFSQCKPGNTSDDNMPSFYIQDDCDCKLSNKTDDEFSQNNELQNTPILATEEIENLSQKLSQTSITPENYPNTNDKLMSSQSATGCQELDKSEVILPSQNIFSGIQFSPDYKADYASIIEPCQYVLQDSLLFQPLLNCELKCQSIVSTVVEEEDAENNDRCLNDDRKQEGINIQKASLSDDHDTCIANSCNDCIKVIQSDSEIFQKGLYSSIDSKVITKNQATTKRDLDGCKIPTQCTSCTTCSTDQPNMPIECNQSNNMSQISEDQSVEIQFKDIWHSCDSEINATVSSVIEAILIQCDTCIFQTDFKSKSKINTDYHQQCHSEMETSDSEETNDKNPIENKEYVDSVMDIKQNSPLENVGEHDDIPQDSQRKTLAQENELVHKSENVISLENNKYFQSIGCMMDYPNKQLESEVMLLKGNSNIPCIPNLQQPVDNSNDVHLCNSNRRELITGQKLIYDMGCQGSETPIISKHSENVTEISKKEDTEPIKKDGNLQSSFSFVSREDQLVPDEETRMEITESLFYDKDEYQKNLREFLPKNSNCLSENQCFKWRYTPSVGLGDIVPDEQLKTEGYADNLRNLPVLKTCSRPIRIGLSRRQKAGRLHCVPWKK